MNPEIEINDVISELRREYNTRARVYPNWIAHGSLKQSTADIRQARLSRAIELLEAMQAKMPKPSAFDEPELELGIEEEAPKSNPYSR